MATREPTVPKVLMIGPSLTQRGGIASVESAYSESWDPNRYQLRLIASYTCHYNSKPKKLAIALVALMRMTWSLLFWRPDIVHIHFSWRGSFYRKTAFVFLTRALGRPKLILHCHAADFAVFYSSSVTAPQWLIRRTLAMSDVLLVLSRSQRVFFESILPAQRMQILANPVGRFRIAAAERERIVLTLGELGTRKGTYDTLKAIPAILERCPDLEFWLGGDGDVERVTSIVSSQGWKDRVRILGWVGKEEKEKLLARALLFLLPSYKEGLPVAVLEAMASGLPIVTTPVGGIPELISDEREALLVKPGAVDEIVTAVTRLSDDEDLRNRLADSARQKVLQECDTSVVLGKLFAVYDSLLSRSAREQPATECA